VCVQLQPDGTFTAVPVPADILARLQAALTAG
jgi:hypothetical protein